VTVASDQGFVGTVTLPIKSQIEQAVAKDGYKPSSFADSYENTYRFGSEFTVIGDETLVVVWSKDEEKKDEDKKDESDVHNASSLPIGTYSAKQFPAWHSYKAPGYKSS
jgi:hypothetical protein